MFIGHVYDDRIRKILVVRHAKALLDNMQVVLLFSGLTGDYRRRCNRFPPYVYPGARRLLLDKCHGFIRYMSETIIWSIRHIYFKFAVSSFPVFKYVFYLSDIFRRGFCAPWHGPATASINFSPFGALAAGGRVRNPMALDEIRIKASKMETEALSFLQAIPSG